MQLLALMNRTVPVFDERVPFPLDDGRGMPLPRCGQWWGIVALWNLHRAPALICSRLEQHATADRLCQL
jgi:hypothetical protein